MADAITGFEGIVDTLSLSLQRQQQRAARQAQLLQLPGAERGIETLSDTLGALFQAFSPDAPQRRAQAVDTARANARARVQGQQFDSPIEQRMALVRTAAEELREQGMFAEADRLDANADLMYEQALKLKELGGKVEGQDLENKRLKLQSQHWATDFANTSRLTAAQADDAEFSLDEKEKGLDDRLRRLKAEADSAVGEAGLVGIRRQREIAALENERIQIQLGRANLDANKYGKDVNVTAPGLGNFSAKRLPDGTIRFTNPQTRQIETLPAGMYVEVGLSGSQAEVSSPNSPAGQAAARARATASLLANALSLKQNMVDNPNSRTFLARAAGTLDNLRSEIATVQAQLPADQVAADNKLFDEYFRRKNISNAVQQAQIKALSYGFARVYEPSAPALSSADVERGGAQVGGASPTDAVTSAVLDESIRIQMDLTLRELRETGQEVSPGLLEMYNQYKNVKPATTQRRQSPSGGGLSAGPPVPRNGTSPILNVESRN